MLKKINLKNKTALVTGAGKGLGKACAIALAEACANEIMANATLVKVGAYYHDIGKMENSLEHAY